MRFNFRKIASALASTAMVGATIGLAAAASFPAPFVDNGSADVAIVYGSNLDLSAVGEISSSLSSALASQGGSSTTVTGDFVPVEKSNDKFTLGDNAGQFNANYDGDDLEILADGVYENDDNDDFDYTQEVTLGSSLVLDHIQDNDFNNEEPFIGFAVEDGDEIMNYTVEFSPDAEGGDDWELFESTSLEIMGKEYYILSATNASGGTLELLDSANTVVLNEGETVTVQAGSNSYDVSISFIDAEVKLVVNGEVTPALEEDDTYKLDSGDYIGIKEILSQDYQGGIKQVEFSIGSGKIELTDGQEVEVNGEKISDDTDHVLTAYFGTSGSNLQDLTIQWTADEDMWLGFDTDTTELVMPLFESVKLSLGEFAPDAAEEVTNVAPDGDDKFSLDVPVSDGDVNFNFLFANSSGTGFEGIGADTDELLLTGDGTADPTLTWNENSSYFVATWISGDDHESYVLEVTDIADEDDNNETTIRSIASGGEEITIESGETEVFGDHISLTVTADSDAQTATIVLGDSQSDTYADKIVTDEGLQIQLPYDSLTSTGSGAMNFTAGDVAAPFVMNFTEENEDGDVARGSSFTANLGLPSQETSVQSVSPDTFETSDNSDDFEGYVDSELATKVLLKTGGDQDELEITYHGDEAYAEVFLAESGAATDSSSNLGNVNVMADELADSGMQSKNLIIVGGSCVNSAAASVLGLTSPSCGSAWESATGAGEGEWIIQSFANPWSSSKVATLVAGYSQSDTVNAATALTTQEIDTTAGMKYTGTTGTSATPVVN